MADMENLRTASLYINNQLLSRGLLRDGHSIDFADPNGDPGGLPAAMGRIMSVVNDLILKRDRDAEHRESLSSTLRTIRAETLRQTTDYTRQADKLADAQRKLDSADSTERALRTQLKTAEATIHKMKDEMQKMKTLVAQTRSSCANEVRKRDRQIEALKKTVTEAARVRGGARSRDVVSISVTGDFGAEQGGGAPPMGATSDAEYSLRMETNEFLTRLAKTLSEENEGLMSIVRQTVDSLREMSGLEAENLADSSNTASNNNGKGAEELASELETIMEHLRNILTNPSFVPLEEVEMRDEEIHRLRAGIEKMETRWKDAVRMIDGWRRRMGSGGKSVDMEELSNMGLRLSPVRIRDVVETGEPMELSCVQEEEEEEEEEMEVVKKPPVPLRSERKVEKIIERPRSPSPVESLHLVEASGGHEVDPMQYDEDIDSDSSSVYDDDLLSIEEMEQVEEPNFEVLQESTATAPDSSPLPEPPQISPLKDSLSAGNKRLDQGRQQQQQQPPPQPRLRQPSRKRAGDFGTVAEEEQTLKLSGASSIGGEEQKKREKKEPVPPSRMTRLAARRSLEKSADSFEVAYESPHFGKKSSERDSELRLFSKPAPPALEPVSKPKKKTTTTTHRAKAESTKTALPSRRGPAARQAAAAANRAEKEQQQRQQSEGPAEKKLRRSLPEPEAGKDDQVQEKAPASKSVPAPPKTEPARSSTNGVDNNSARASFDSAAAAKAAASTAAAQARAPAAAKDRNRSPIRPPPGSAARLPPPRRQMPPAVAQSPLTMETITAKLAASEREADAARVRAKLKAARLGRKAAPGLDATVTATTTDRPVAPPAAAAEKEEPRRSPVKKVLAPAASQISPVKKTTTSQQPPVPNHAGGGRDGDVEIQVEDRDMPDELMMSTTTTGAGGYPEEEEQQHGGEEDGHEQQPKIEVVKRKRDRRLSQATSRRASRRRSTLSPWELESLISGNVGPTSPARERKGGEGK